ncbi:hypothetical protein BN863_28770 [Formosa agariphila KMM 3901]|uniref:Uncharacterized protein n=1 Tax=Formosa agariphila (strain DSM 15362 / KCTC 12365 / LMG 23005 / KMM 3901 / M-2Alg 35-1) TaxID=1347342 RepID=T2KRF0_FORAG|nr:hypothetical protein [Formosa agariphila]CDF80589.1 hypothetical protein BN863_28770 [Formosa agariphila KMM 3901]
MLNISFIQTDTEKELFKFKLKAVPRRKEFIIYDDLQYIVDYVFYSPGQLIRVLISPTDTSFFKTETSKRIPFSDPIVVV